MTARKVSSTSSVVFSQYSGAVELTAEGPSTELQATALGVLFLSPDQTRIALDHSQSASIDLAIRSSVDGKFELVADGPLDWHLELDDSGTLTITPAPGTQDGNPPRPGDGTIDIRSEHGRTDNHSRRSDTRVAIG